MAVRDKVKKQAEEIENAQQPADDSVAIIRDEKDADVIPVPMLSMEK